MRTRFVAQGKRSQAGFGGGAVALSVELMSCHTMLPEKAHYAPSVAGEDEGVGLLQGIGG